MPLPSHLDWAKLAKSRLHVEEQMEDSDVKTLLAAMGTEILAAGGAPLPSLGGVALALGGPWAARKVEEAFVILTDRFRGIRKLLTEAQAEEFRAMLLRYIRSAQEGAAHRNLRLMGSVMAGMIKRDAVHADDFLREATILSELSSKEIVILGSIWRITEEDGHKLEHGRNARKASALLVPGVFPKDRQFVEALSALSRTGLVMPLSHQPGHMEYVTTAAFERLTALVDFNSLDGDNL